MRKGPSMLQPVSPDGMEILFFYGCPHCGRHVPVPSPVQPAMVQCDACRQAFPIMPVDERGMQFIRIMLGGGKAAVDPDFL